MHFKIKAAVVGVIAAVGLALIVAGTVMLLKKKTENTENTAASAISSARKDAHRNALERLVREFDLEGVDMSYVKDAKKPSFKLNEKRSEFSSFLLLGFAFNDAFEYMISTDFLENKYESDENVKSAKKTEMEKELKKIEEKYKNIKINEVKEFTKMLVMYRFACNHSVGTPLEFAFPESIDKAVFDPTVENWLAFFEERPDFGNRLSALTLSYDVRSDKYVDMSFMEWINNVIISRETGPKKLFSLGAYWYINKNIASFSQPLRLCYSMLSEVQRRYVPRHIFLKFGRGTDCILTSEINVIPDLGTVAMNIIRKQMEESKEKNKYEELLRIVPEFEGAKGGSREADKKSSSSVLDKFKEDFFKLTRLISVQSIWKNNEFDQKYEI